MTKTRLQKVIDFYGIEAQKTKAIEELSELIRALCRNDEKNIIEEIADVSIMLAQLITIYDCEEEADNMIKRKLERTMKRILMEQILDKSKGVK